MNTNKLLSGFVQDYLSNDYKKDLQFIFERNDTMEKWLFRGLSEENLERIKLRNCTSSAENPLRNLIFSGVFLYQLMVHIVLWDDMGHNENCKYTHKELYKETFKYDDYTNFLEKSGWPDFGLDIYLEFAMENSKDGFLPDGVKKIMDRYGLMTSMRKDASHQFVLACVFKAMQDALQTEMWNLDVPEEVSGRILEKAESCAVEILDGFKI